MFITVRKAQKSPLTRPLRVQEESLGVFNDCNLKPDEDSKLQFDNFFPQFPPLPVGVAARCASVCR